MTFKTILIIEAFYGGSHKQLIDLIFREFSDCAEVFTLPAKKWHWRSITSCLHFADVIPREHGFRTLFTSSVLPLAELIAIRPDLAKLKKIVYFHENQMAYPVQQKKERYFQHGFNEVLTCLTADKILFNSKYNKESFLSSLKSHFNCAPDHRPKNLREQIEHKTSVLYFPVDIPDSITCLSTRNTSFTVKEGENSNLQAKPLHIIWPHRWEHDKNPGDFFYVMRKLKEMALPFQLSVIGESFTEKPKIFEDSFEALKDNIVHWGYQQTKDDYFSVLQSADVVVSTSNHEFFGVSMLEATGCGCFPLCPDRLSYPELYPAEHRYKTTTQLFKKLRYFCQKPYVVRSRKSQIDISRFSWKALGASYKELLWNKTQDGE